MVLRTWYKTSQQFNHTLYIQDEYYDVTTLFIFNNNLHKLTKLEQYQQHS